MTPPDSSASSAIDGGHPLSGVRVIDASSSYAGPTAAMYLGDLGAEVIKIERPRSGDDARSWGPPFIGEEAAWFLSGNRNKKSVCLDLSSSTGRATLRRILGDTDVFIQNLNPGKLRRAGLHPEDLCAAHPRLICCVISGFGLDGPQSERPGYDLIAQARSGLMSLTGPAGGQPERVSAPVSDVVSGMLAALTISAALVRQQRTGVGEIVDISLLEADLALIAPRVASFLAGEPEPRPSGGTDSVLAVYQTFATADRPVALAIGNDGMWQRCCEVLELGDVVAGDPDLSTNAGRRSRRAELIALIGDRMTTPARTPLARCLRRRQRALPARSQPVRGRRRRTGAGARNHRQLHLQRRGRLRGGPCALATRVQRPWARPCRARARHRHGRCSQLSRVLHEGD